MPGSGANLPVQLDRLESRLQAFGAPIAGAFRPGAAPDQVRETLIAEGLAAHEDIVAWWSWHDGAEVAAPPVESGPGIYYRAENTLVGPWHVLSLAEATRSRRWLRETHDELGLGHLFPVSWVPVLTTDGAGELCAETAAQPAPLHINGEGYLGGEPPLFTSLAEFVALVERAFSEGQIVAGADDPRVPAIAATALKSDFRRLVLW